MYITLYYILACPEGSYGKHCSFCCSPNCKTCRHTDGVCTCKAGWTGWNCTTGTSTLMLIAYVMN